MSDSNMSDSNMSDSNSNMSDSNSNKPGDPRVLIDPELDETLEQIARSIFTKHPQEKNSIRLELERNSEDDDQDDIEQYESGINQYVFNILFLITYKGIEILFNLNNILDLTEDQYTLLQKYVNSFGYTMEVYGNNSEETDSPKTPWEILDNGEILKNCSIAFKAIS